MCTSCLRSPLPVQSPAYDGSSKDLAHHYGVVMFIQRHLVDFAKMIRIRRAAKCIAAGTFVAVTCSATLIPVSPADAWVAGYFHIRHTAHDPFGGQALRAMDVLDHQQKVSGFVELTATTFARDSQLWQVLFPRTGSIGFVKFQNKLTGQCIGEAEHGDGSAVLRPCTDPSVIWNVISMSGNRMAIQKITQLAQPFGSIHVCLTKETTEALVGHALVETCNSGPDSTQIWEAYVSG